MFVVITFFVLTFLVIFGVRTTRIETVRQMARENAKPGTSSVDVTRFLDAHHLEHTDLMHPALMNLYGHRYDNEWIIVSARNHTWRSAFQSERLELVFVFDENHRLVSFDLFPVYTGL